MNNKASAIEEIHRQKLDTLSDIRREKSMMKVYGNKLFAPYNSKKHFLENTSIGRISQTVSGAAYAFRICKGIFSLLRKLH